MNIDDLEPDQMGAMQSYLESELARIEARENIEAYVKYTMPGWQSGRHHDEIFAALTAFERKEIPRLIIEAPPRHGKTETASRRFSSYVMGKIPETQVVCSTYNQDFANDIGRDVRHIVQSERYSRVFPEAGLRRDSKAADRFHLENDSRYVAVGRGSALTGRGMHFGVVDDPLKDRKEAESQRTRNELWDWFRAVFYTRQMPNCSILVMNTRWHEDDLTGRLLEQEGDKWYRLTLPAISDEGGPNEEALWAEWYPLETLYDIRATIGPRDWLALYQQRPTSEQGTTFKAEWFQERYKRRPTNLTKYLVGDFATVDGGGDYTELGVFGVDDKGEIYVLDWWYGQTTTDVWVHELLRMAKQHQVLEFVGETGLIRRAVEPLLNVQMRETKIWVPTQWLPHQQAGKVINARPFQGMCAMGMVHFPEAEWADRVIDQLVKFPDGRYDDGADVCFLLGRYVADLVSARKPQIKERRKIIAQGSTGLASRTFPVSYFKRPRKQALY